MAGSKVVVIEDEPDILEVIAYNLQREGLTVATQEDGEQGLELVRRELPDLVLLDLMLPGLDGLEVCRQIKSDPRTGHIPVIMVTAKSEESDVVLGLYLGADDYITKPFRPREMIARVRAALRRGQGTAPTPERERLDRDGIVIDSGRHEVLVEGRVENFTATEFRLLHFLASHPGRVFSRAELIERVIGEGAIVIDRNIDVHVRAIRKKMGPHRDLIETVRGVGYRFRDSEG